MTRQEIEHLQVGDFLSHTPNTRHGKVQPGAWWSSPQPIVEIYARGDSITGKAFICFYLAMNSGAKISGSIIEGEECYQLVKEENDPEPYLVTTCLSGFSGLIRRRL